VPTPVGHSLSGAVIYALTTKSENLVTSWRWGVTFMLAAALADIDFLPAMFGDLDLANSVHRYFTHTLLFAAVVGLAALGILRVLGQPGLIRSSAVLFSCLVAHIFLDLLGKDFRPPIGVPFLWPFVRRSFKLPVQIFPSLLKDTYAEIVSLHNIGVVAAEVLMLGGLLGIVVVVKKWLGVRGRGSGK
jgi:membrane-bound metal-dependent hydrolase YbcI (DUF457 family)